MEDIVTSSISDALDLADTVHWTQQPPQSDYKRLRFLAAYHGDLAAAAAHLPSATELYLKKLIEQRRSAPKDLNREIAVEIARRWQLDVRRAAHERIIAQGERITVAFRAWLGYDAPTVPEGDGRHRLGRQHLFPHDTALLLEARDRKEDDAVLQDIIGAGIGEVYFRVSRDSRQKIYFCNIDFVEFAYDNAPASVPT